MSSRIPEPDAAAIEHSGYLLAHLRDLIASQGPLSFAQYMERCLYAPGLGYYSIGTTKFGSGGDFVTAPELGVLFARCVANVIRPLLLQMGAAADVLELGGGSGALAEVVLKALASQDVLPCRYLILEPSADLRTRQQQRLQAALPTDLMARVAWLERPPEQTWHGVLLANEVIDALPATRFTVQRGDVYEEHVTLGEGATLKSIDLPADTLVSSVVRHLERDLGQAFAAGYRSEVLPQLPYWIQAIAGTLTVGVMLFMDYGYVRREYYLPERRDGTLMAHYRHHAHTDPLWLPGLNDLTASVDFTALAEAGNQAGFDVATYLPQAQFLLGAGLQMLFQEACSQASDELERYRLAREVKRLTLPDQMGERFQAMLLTRGIEKLAIPTELLAIRHRARL